MNINKVLFWEWLIAIGITSWGAIKQGYAPWPPNVVLSTIAMIILSMLEVVDERLSALLGAGFLLALLVNAAQGGQGSIAQTFAALPQQVGYDVLQIGSSSNVNGANGNGQPVDNSLNATPTGPGGTG